MVPHLWQTSGPVNYQLFSTDNCVKNHFYSKLRKSLRSLNKKIHKFLKKEYKEIKTSSLYKVIETLENRNRQSSPNP